MSTVSVGTLFVAALIVGVAVGGEGEPEAGTVELPSAWKVGTKIATKRRVDSLQFTTTPAR